MQQTLTANVTVVVNESLVFTPNTLPVAVINTAYPETVLGAVTGGVAPYVFTETGLPAGMVLSNDGKLSGTPTVSGTFNVVVTIKDSGI